jgi:hypothetical protein
MLLLTQNACLLELEWKKQRLAAVALLCRQSSLPSSVINRRHQLRRFLQHIVLRANNASPASDKAIWSASQKDFSESSRSLHGCLVVASYSLFRIVLVCAFAWSFTWIQTGRAQSYDLLTNVNGGSSRHAAPQAGHFRESISRAARVMAHPPRNLTQIRVQKMAANGKLERQQRVEPV